MNVAYYEKRVDQTNEAILKLFFLAKLAVFWKMADMEFIQTFKFILIV